MWIGEECMSFEEWVLMLLRSYIKNESIEIKNIDYDISQVFEFSRRHKIENITLAAVKKTKLPIDDTVLHQWEDLCDENTVQLMFQETEKERLVNAFNEAKIAFLPLKGWHLRDVYPKQEYRFMSDLDILIYREDRKAVCLLLRDLGYSGGIGDYGSDDSYTLEPCIHVEMHLDMVSVEHEKWYSYYQTIWDKAVLVSGYEYKLNWNDYFIYMMINFLKDYTLKGTGIRSIIDFYFFLEKYKSELDFEYINKEFRKLDVYDLAQETLQIVDDWFGDNPKILGSEIGDKLLNSGIYGTSEELVQHRFDMLSANVKGRSAKKFVYLLKRAFPAMIIMKYKYPILNKAPFLLPVCWCIRLIRHNDRARLEIDTIKKVKD